MKKLRVTVWDREGVIDFARELVSKGMSAGQISRELSGRYETDVSRNAVIGKLRRLGIELLGPAVGIAIARKLAAGKPVVRRRPRPKMPKAITYHDAPHAGEPAPRGDVDDGCRWLHGEATDRNFCGASLWQVSKYCPHHFRRCFTPPDPQKMKAFNKSARKCA